MDSARATRFTIARSATRRLTAAAAALLLPSAAIVGAAAPAHADTVVVSTRAQFVAAVSAPCGGATAADPRVIVIGANFGNAYDAEVLYVSCHVRVDLDGKIVRSGAIALRDGTSMHLMSSTGSGSLYALANGSNRNHAGIRTSQAELTIDGVFVEAQGALFGAGIGGGGVTGYGIKTGESGGTVRILGGARVIAHGGDRAAGIGGGAANAGAHGTGIGADMGLGRGGPGPNLTISGAGTDVYADGYYGAGIGGGNGIGNNSSAEGGRGGVGGTVSITDGAVVTAWSYRGAGIGGGAGTGYGTTYGGRGGTVIVENATVNATSSLAAAIGGGDSSEVGSHGGTLEVRSGGKVTATASASGAGFGTGRLGANGDSDEMRLIVEEGGVLTVGSASLSALRIGAGLAQIDGTVNVTSKTLTVDSSRFTIGSTGRLTGANATLNGGGRITNDGTILMKTVTGIAVAHNNFPVSFHRAGGSVEGLRVYAPSFSAAGAAIPAPASGHAWNTADDGTGAWVTPTTPLTPTLLPEAAWETNIGASPLHVWETTAPADAAQVIIDAPAAATAGVDVEVTATLYDPITDTVLATTGDFTISLGSYGIRRSTTGWTITRAGVWDVTASIVVDGHEYQHSVPVTVSPGPLASAALSPATATVADGDAVTFEVVGYDGYDNEVALSPVLLSSESADEVDGLEVTFHGGGMRTVSVEVAGAVVATSEVRVFDAASRYEVLLTVDETVEAGVPFPVEVTLVDRMTDTAVADPDAVSLVTSTDATPFLPGIRTEHHAGPLTLTATVSHGGHSYTAATAVEVVAGPVASLSLVPASTTVRPHDSVTFTLSGADAYGNAVDTSAALLQDVTAGTPAFPTRTLTFDTLGDITVRATLGAAQIDALVEVRPDPSRTAITLPDGPGVSTAGDSIPLRVVVGDTVTDEVYPVAAGTVTWVSTSGALVDAGDETGVETLAGTHLQTATVAFWGLTLQASRGWTVVAAEAAELTLTPTQLDTLDGSTHLFAITAEDAYGNPAATSGAVLTSSNPADTVSGWSVTFAGAGDRRVVAVLGDATTDAEVRVAAVPTTPVGTDPDPADSDPAEQGPADSGPAGEGPRAEGDGGSGTGNAGAGEADRTGDSNDADASDDSDGSDAPAAEAEAETESESDASAVSDTAPPWWIWLLLAAIVVAVIAGAITLALRRRSRAF